MARTHAKPAYKPNGYGFKVETSASIRRRIAAAFGFQASRIVLCEASYKTLYYDGDRFSYCASVSFRVNGAGYDTDFEDIDRSRIWDA